MIYLDHNATTQPAPQVIAAMLGVMQEAWGNPSSTHRFGQEAKARLELARQQVAKLIGAKPNELCFTSGGTEANNWAILGLLAPLGGTLKNGLVTARVEHPSVRTVAEDLEKAGAPVAWIPLGPGGEIVPEQVAQTAEALARTVAAQGGDRVVVSCMWANNETGVINPVRAIADALDGARLRLREAGMPVRLFFHCDAVQAAGKLPVDAPASGVDALVFSAHKIHGVKGVGALWCRRGVKPVARQRGGSQEKEVRPGTENIAGAVGFGVAAEAAAVFVNDEEAQARLRQIRDRLETQILARIPEAVVNAAGLPRLGNTSSVAFPFLEAEAILVGLSEQGVCASAGSACSSGSIEASPVLLAAGIPEFLAHGTVRLSLSRNTTPQEVDQTAEILCRVVGRLRKLLPNH